MYKDTPMQVTPHIHMIRIPFTVRISDDAAIDRFVNVFIITGPTITLVDAGVAGSEEQIFGYIRSIGRDPAEIALLLLTHAHPDHIGGALAIRQATGCAVAAGAGERAWIEDVNLQCASRPVPGFHNLVQGSVPVDRVLADGDVLELGEGHELDCIVFFTPGHSQGSLSFLIRNEGALITGDAVPVPGDLPVYDDVLASVQSIRRLAGIGEIRVLLSSWDEPREGICAYQRMREALEYLQRIHDSAIRAGGGGAGDPMDLCRRVAADLGLPPGAATPLLARTLFANLRLFDRPDLLLRQDNCRTDGGAARESGDRKLLN